MSEDDLLAVFEKVNVRIGDLNPCVVKAWFDTDCDNLLKWICTSITEDCYVSAQEQSEYEKLECIFTDNQLDNQIESIETQFPDIFQTEVNLYNIDIANYTIDILEEQLENYNQQLEINQHLYDDLLREYSKISSDEIQSQLQEESAQENCLKLSRQLDQINNQTFNQIVQYKDYLLNYEDTEVPEFLNNFDTRQCEETFNNITSNLQNNAKFDSFLEMSVGKHENTLHALGNRIYNSKISNLALQMEMEGLQRVSKFFERFDLSRFLLSTELASLQSTITLSKDKQKWMLKEIEESTSKLVENYVNQPLLKYSQSEHDFFMSKLKYLDKFNDSLMNIFLHFIIIYTLYLQEKLDIKNSCEFFRNINKYVKKDIQESSCRKEAMLKVFSDYEHFCLKPMKDKIKLIDDFRMIVMKNKKSNLTEIVEETELIRSRKENFQKQYVDSFFSNIKQLHKLLPEVRTLKTFLISGFTCQIVTVPCQLQLLFFEVNTNLQLQHSAVKYTIQAAQKPKEQLAQNKWLRHRNHLWMNFITNGTQMISFLNQLKQNMGCTQRD